MSRLWSERAADAVEQPGPALFDVVFRMVMVDVIGKQWCALGNSGPNGTEGGSGVGGGAYG